MLAKRVILIFVSFAMLECSARPRLVISLVVENKTDLLLDNVIVPIGIFKNGSTMYPQQSAQHSAINEHIPDIFNVSWQVAGKTYSETLRVTEKMRSSAYRMVRETSSASSDQRFQSLYFVVTFEAADSVKVEFRLTN